MPAMGTARRSQRVTEQDWIELLRLAGELSELQSDPHARISHGLTTLARLIDARCAMGMSVAHLPNGLPTHVSGGVVYGLEASEKPLVRGDFFRDEPLHPLSPYFASTGAIAPLVTRRRQDVVEDNAWYRNDHIQQVCLRVNSDATIMSKVFRPSDNIHTVIAFTRPCGETQFNERETRILEIGHDTLAKMLQIPTAAPAVVPAATVVQPLGVTLSPRLQMVLDHLLKGDSAKQIAFAHKLSLHTVYEYIKQLYRKCGVSGRGELMAKFIR